MREPYLFYDEKISQEEPQTPPDHNVKYVPCTVTHTITEVLVDPIALSKAHRVHGHPLRSPTTSGVKSNPLDW
jgi:hypothetical protein